MSKEFELSKFKRRLFTHSNLNTDYFYKRKNMKTCIEHPLGIFCRCKEYREVIDKFTIYQPGTQNPYVTEVIAEPSPMKIVWIPRKTEKNVNSTKPVLAYSTKKENTIDPFLTETEIQKWIPLNDLFSPKKLRENMSFLHQGSLTTQSSEVTTLTDMLPHRGRPVKRRDIDWSVGSHLTAVEMTDEPETNFKTVKGCFSIWAKSFKFSTGQHPY